jgi:hypothetical protein
MSGELTRIKQALEDWINEDPKTRRTVVLTDPQITEILRAAEQKKRTAHPYEHFT